VEHRQRPLFGGAVPMQRTPTQRGAGASTSAATPLSVGDSDDDFVVSRGRSQARRMKGTPDGQRTIDSMFSVSR